MPWDKRSMTKWYDEYAKKTEIPDDQIVSVPNLRYKRIARDIDTIILQMNINNNDRVLDAGCGAGRFISRIKMISECTICGIDTSCKMIERAKKRVHEISYVIADILNTPFRNNSFTAIICYSVLWHIPPEKGAYFSNEVYEDGLTELKNLLSKEGKLVFNIINPFHLQNILTYLVTSIKSRLLKRTCLITYKISLRTTKKILNKRKLIITRIKPSEPWLINIETCYKIFKRLEKYRSLTPLIKKISHSYTIFAKYPKI